MKVAVCQSGFSSGNEVFYSTNGGANWANLSGNLPNLPANALAWTEGPPVRHGRRHGRRRVLCGCGHECLDAVCR
jgi:hypothetical protein